jgi:predicted nucleic acid-binding protein
MIVVSNSSPLISLGAIGRLGLLRTMYGLIAIPRAVHHEVAVQGSGRPGAVEVQSFAWIRCCDVGNPNVAAALQGKLDRGEAEAIALALELPADLLLMDERLARIEANRFGIRFIGTLGVLIEAKARGHLQEVTPVLDELRIKAGFHVSEALRARVLQQAGE